MKKKYVEVILRNPINKSDTFQYIIEPFDIPIVDRWLARLKEALIQRLPLEKNFCFLGWPTNQRNLDYLLSELDQSVRQINSFGMMDKWKDLGGYKITEDFSKKNIMSSNGELERDFTNRLHHHFEILQGQVGNLSPWYYSADDSTKYAIRQLNNLCHEIESFTSAVKIRNHNPEYVSCAQITTFLHCPRYDLQKEDYEHFTMDRGFGHVYMHWCQIGKTHFEVFSDQDSHVGEAGVGGLKYYSGEFDIEWGPDTINHPWWIETKTKFRKWLIENNFDPDDKTMGYGHLHMAQVDRQKHFGGMSIGDIHNQMGKYLDIFKIIVHEGDQKTEGVFDYSWPDADYKSRQLEFLSQGYRLKPG